jgi:hypothetical protein
VVPEIRGGEEEVSRWEVYIPTAERAGRALSGTGAGALAGNAVTEEPGFAPSSTIWWVWPWDGLAFPLFPFASYLARLADP